MVKIQKQTALDIIKALASLQVLQNVSTPHGHASFSIDDMLAELEEGLIDSTEDDDDVVVEDADDDDDYAEEDEEDDDTRPSVSATDLHVLPKLTVRVLESDSDFLEEGERIELEFEATDTGLDALLDRITVSDVELVTRGGKRLTIESSGGVYVLDVSKFPKEWIDTLPVNTTLAVRP